MYIYRLLISQFGVRGHLQTEACTLNISDATASPPPCPPLNVMIEYHSVSY